jgi:hypothetical protein
VEKLLTDGCYLMTVVAVAEDVFKMVRLGLDCQAEATRSLQQRVCPGFSPGSLFIMSPAMRIHDTKC